MIATAGFSLQSTSLTQCLISGVYSSYLLRSNITDWNGKEFWEAYIQLTQAEAAFRVAKSDVEIRSVWHRKEERVRADILVCFLAYVLWKTLGQMCQAAGLGSEPRKVLVELSAIQTVDVVLPTRQGVELRKRCVARPEPHQAILLTRLGLTLPETMDVPEPKLAPEPPREMRGDVVKKTCPERPSPSTYVAKTQS